MEFDAIMCELQPWWKGVARMYRPSASAFICDASGKDYTGASSLRCYCIIDIAKNAPFGINVADAFWRAGYGRIEFSASGSMLVRCPIDTAVWQPERLDFAGPVVLGSGLTKRKFPPLFLEGGDVDSEQVLYDGIGEVSFSEWSKNSIDVRRAKDAHKPEEKRRKGIVIEERVKADVAGGEDADASRRKWEAAINDDELYGDFQLKFERIGVRTVEDVLNNPLAYDGERLADPHEQGYRGDGRIAVFYANQHNTRRPYIHSHAHGGKNYALKRAP